MLQNVDEAMRLRIRTEARLPLALMERARTLLQEARLVRLREALYLQGSYRADTVELLFVLLRRHGLGQPPFNLMLRDQSEYGPVLARLFPEVSGQRSLVLVWREGGFDLHDENGLRSELEVAEPHGIFEVLAACLPAGYRQRQGWVGEDAPARIRGSMLGWVPAQRQALLRLLGWREARALPPSMRRLDLSNNSLGALPEHLRQLPVLRHLNLRRNRIRMTAGQPGALAELPHLRTLDLSENPLGAISLHSNQLSGLRELRLFRCSLLRVPTGLEWLGMLQHVDLRNNLLSDLPAALLGAPESLRRVIAVQGNALPAQLIERLYAQAAHEHVGGEVVDATDGSAGWLAGVEGGDIENRRRQWEALRREPQSDPLFQLLDELTGSSDYRLVRSDLSRRVWAMIEALNEDTRMRQELFELAADPRTCVDSIASCFGHLEVRLQVLQATHAGDPLTTRAARLLLARRLFRLDRVEAFARQDFQSRIQPLNGEEVDEVEVSLAYRTGLSVRLDLIGQPRTMQFRAIAGVTPSDLDRVYQAVQEAEASDELAVFISQRDFWLPVLRAQRAGDFEALEQRFDSQLQALDEQKEALGSAAYVLQANQLGKDRDAALEALALRLTREALLAQP